MRILLALTTAAFLTACSTTGISREDQNQPIKEFYATLISVAPVELSSEVATGIAAGATFGALEHSDGNTEDIVSGSIAGALIGGLFTAIFEGSDDAYQYQLSSPTEGDFTLIQKETLNAQSGCVRVRMAAKTSIELVDSDFCSPA